MTTTVEQPFTGESVPPHDPEAEAALLGAVLCENKALDNVLEHLHAEDFYRRNYAEIFDAMVYLWTSGKAIDTITLKDELERRGKYDEVGGVETIIEIAEAAPSAASIADHARIIEGHAMRRRLIGTAYTIARDAQRGAEEAGVLLDKAQGDVFRIAERFVGANEPQPASKIIPAVVGRIEGYMTTGKGNMLGVPSGIPDIDRVTRGFKPGEMVLIAARPSIGKTTLAMNVARHLAVDKAVPTLFFSMEVGRESVLENMAVAHARVSANRMRDGLLDGDEQERVSRAANAIMEAPLYVDDSVNLTPIRLRTKARRVASRYGVKCIIVDYLGLMRVSGRPENRTQEVTEISRELKALARELDVPLIALSQLNRNAAGRENHEPHLSDLRDSGALEQDADVVMLLNRPGFYETDGDGTRATVNIAKNRNGETRRIELAFQAECLRFEQAIL